MSRYRSIRLSAIGLIAMVLLVGMPLRGLSQMEGRKDRSIIENPGLKVDDFIGQYALCWWDDFEGEVLDTIKWKYRAEGSKRGFATVSRETIALDGKGNLILQTLKKDGKYYVGQVTTDGIFAQKFGYFECRAQVNKYLGTHSAFWLQTNTMTKENNDPWNNGTEIDIFEYHRNTPDKVHHNLHWNGYGAGHKNVGLALPAPGVDKGYHTFGLLWTEKEYVFFVDGVETWRTSEALSNIAEYIILSTELTGFGGNHLHANYPDSILFDYVKVYRLKG
ncbi:MULTISPECIES: family 16 glycosylhydrolase [Sphingobacterium]|uniref:glycoside hydrolase family 16 protein n=1 Tax=Sphingobacterium TaxID=28453 RepID=UPI0013DC6F0D|nr:MULTISPECIES: glycoside hydrolase family 16 protein [unclassified Sphingobacterium]